MPCSPERWCRRAADLRHPHSICRPLRPDLVSGLSAESASDPVALARRRTEECKDVSLLCKSLVDEEEACRAELHPDVQSVISQKQSVALECLLRLHGHVDPDVAVCVRSGFPLVGWLPCSASEGALQEMALDVSFRGPLVTPRGLQGHALSTVTVPRHSGHSHFSRHCSSESVWLEPKPSAA